MTAFHFGPPTRRLFGILHARDNPGVAKGGVVLVAPFGHEAIRTHRFYRILADRLSRQGHDVLRFDFHGTGDSAGADADVRLAGWAQDVLAAHQELQQRTGVAPAWWMCARLGASAALTALHHWAVKSPGTPLPALALWDPVLDGPGYLAALRVKHVEALEASFSLKDPRWRQRLVNDPSAYLDEAIGFAIPAAFRQEMLLLSPETTTLVRGAHAELLCSPGDARAPSWAQRQDPCPKVHWLEREFDWTSDDSLNTALVPADAMGQLLRIIHGTDR